MLRLPRRRTHSSRHQRGSALWSCLVTAFVTLGPTSAMAASITFAFQAAVSSVADSALTGALPLPISDLFSVGQVLQGRYTFESTTPPGSASGYPAGTAFYPTALTDFDLVGPSFSQSSPFSYNKMLIRNSATISDLYSFTVTWDGGTGPVFDGIGAADDVFFMELSDLDRTALTSNSIPVLPPDLSQFELPNWHMTFAYVVDPYDINSPYYYAEVKGGITSLTLVPEPSSHLLIGIGLFALTVARRRSR